jgi:hypothetical protein
MDRLQTAAIMSEALERGGQAKERENLGSTGMYTLEGKAISPHVGVMNKFRTKHFINDKKKRNVVIMD